MTKPSTSIYLRKATNADLAKLAASRNYVQTRGVGMGLQPSVSQFIDAIGAGELVAIGPVARWCDVTSALRKVLSDGLSEVEHDTLSVLLAQIEREANFDDDDV